MYTTESGLESLRIQTDVLLLHTLIRRSSPSTTAVFLLLSSRSGVSSSLSLSWLLCFSNMFLV